MNKPQFVLAYERTVDRLLATVPRDEAMAHAVGGGPFDAIGIQEADVLARLGLAPNHRIIDLGCGSGRLAKQLGRRYPALDYLGVDIVQALIDHAAGLSPPGFRFALNYDLNFPAPDASADFIVAFSVFTHLRYEETYCYLRDARRVLAIGGAVVMSFLELPYQWGAFEETVRLREGNADSPMNVFHDRSTITAWAGRLGFDVEVFLSPKGLGQSVAMLRKQ